MGFTDGTTIVAHTVRNLVIERSGFLGALFGMKAGRPAREQIKAAWSFET